LITAVSTDSSGRFILKGIDITGDARLIATAAGEKDRLEGWVLPGFFKIHICNDE